MGVPSPGIAPEPLGLQPSVLLLNYKGLLCPLTKLESINGIRAYE